MITSNVLHAVLRASLDLGLLDRSRRVGDVGLARTELLEAATGAGGADRDLDPAVLRLEVLGNEGEERRDSARPVDQDLPAEL